ncbi:hypothetical protein SLA_3530 [Streptomyces laurentii]|uniref:Uncharacterized protein n=1 Tax=Streptomyces laurentii TaxID=39478 RepID=A0A161JHD0_STRLU|nr:hypothetical protein SLA_3530 [Streptomyces laurentii]
MSMKPLEHDRRYGELDQVMRAYLGQPADDTPERRSRALDAYLRHTWQTRPSAVAEAERQLRAYSQNPRAASVENWASSTRSRTPECPRQRSAAG